MSLESSILNALPSDGTPMMLMQICVALCLNTGIVEPALRKLTEDRKIAVGFVDADIHWVDGESANWQAIAKAWRKSQNIDSVLTE